MQGKVELIKSDGTKISIDLISLFSIKLGEIEKNYILLTANEVDQNGLIKIMAAEVIDGKLEKITDQGQWTAVKSAMRAIISSSKGNFNYVNPGSVSLTYVVNDDFARVIAVQEVAKTQLMKDYEANKPSAPVENEEPEQKEEDPDAVIYPHIEGTQSGDEVSPGISENGMDENKEDANDSTDEEPTEPESASEPTEPEVQNVFQTEPPVENDTESNVPVNNTNPETVASVEPAPLKDIVDDFSNREAKDMDYAREKLVSIIMAAVDEYVDTIKKSKDESLEINALKTNIKAMQDQLNEMANALNTQE